MLLPEKNTAQTHLYWVHVGFGYEIQYSRFNQHMLGLKFDSGRKIQPNPYNFYKTLFKESYIQWL